MTFKVRDAMGVYRKLLGLRVIVRPIEAYGMPHHLRGHHRARIGERTVSRSLNGRSVRLEGIN